MVTAGVRTLCRCVTAPLTLTAHRVLYYLADDVTVSPSLNGAPGGNFIQELINWVAQYGLLAALGALLFAGGLYGFSTATSNSVRGSRAREIALGACAGAVIIGLASTVINLLFHAANA